ncbi:MAG: hypothetical protein WC926_05095 [Candidatus Paceibacterota bacterium]|jgi:predicted nucleic acid-binding protein
MKLGNNTFFRHLQKDKLPQNKVLFWDTSLPAAAIFNHPNSDMRKGAINFIDRLAKEKIYIAFSSVLFDEFTQVSVINELKKSQLSKSQAKKALLEKNEKIIRPHINDIQRNILALHNILSKFKLNHRVVFPIEPGIISKSLELLCQYQLERADSIHIATMLYGAQSDIACFDKHDFGKVEGLNLWCKY